MDSTAASDKPLVSVKMLTFNHVLYIAEAIEGVLAQRTDFRYELVIGEDCSTDGTREIVEQYRQKYPDIIRVVSSAENVGMHANSIRVTNACDGRYIAWCEGDDYWQRVDKLSLQVAYLETHPECGMVFSDHDREEVDAGVTRHRHARQLGKDALEDPGFLDVLTGRTAIATCTVVARTDLVKQLIAADPQLHQSGRFRMGDTQLWAEIAMNARIHYLDVALGTRRVLRESMTQSNEIRKRLDFWISSAEMRLYLCDKYRVDQYHRSAVENDWRQRSLQRAFLDRDPAQARAVRRQSSRFTSRDWAWYLSICVPVLRPLLKGAVWMVHRYKNDRDSVSHLVLVRS